MASHLMFVYGTLKTSQPNHYLMDNPTNGTARFIGRGHTTKKFPLVVASPYNIPFVLYKEGTGKEIQGELWEVDDAMLAVLDVLESHPDFYERDVTQIVLTEDSQGQTQCIQKECWLYFLKKYKPELLELPFLDNYDKRGDALAYKEKRKQDSGTARKAVMMQHTVQTNE